MRKLDIKNYTISVKNQQGLTQLIPYDFKTVLLNVVTHPQLQLNGIELLEAKPLIEKIEKADIEVMLTEEEYLNIVGNLKKIKGFIKNDMQFIERILKCPHINEDEKIEFSKN
jgi:hypothetical protein